MTKTISAAGPDALAAFDLGDLPKMLGAGDTPEDVHYLDLLQCAIQGYRHDLQTPEVRVGNIAETAGDVARLSQELAKAVLRLAEQVKAIETPGFFSPSRGRCFCPISRRRAGNRGKYGPARQCGCGRLERGR